MVLGSRLEIDNQGITRLGLQFLDVNSSLGCVNLTLGR